MSAKSCWRCRAFEPFVQRGSKAHACAGDGFRRRPMRAAAFSISFWLRPALRAFTSHARSEPRRNDLRSFSLRLHPLRERPVGRGASLHGAGSIAAHIPDRMHPKRAAPVCRDTPEVKTTSNDKERQTKAKRPGSFRNPGLCGYRVGGAASYDDTPPGPGHGLASPKFSSLASRDMCALAARTHAHAPSWRRVVMAIGLRFMCGASCSWGCAK